MVQGFCSWYLPRSAHFPVVKIQNNPQLNICRSWYFNMSHLFFCCNEIPCYACIFQINPWVFEEATYTLIAVGCFSSISLSNLSEQIGYKIWYCFLFSGQLTYFLCRKQFNFIVGSLILSSLGLIDFSSLAIFSNKCQQLDKIVSKMHKNWVLFCFQ